MCEEIIKLALAEDLKPHGDLSSLLLDHREQIVSARIVAKADGIMACSWLAAAVLEEYARMHKVSDISCKSLYADGKSFTNGAIVFEITAPAFIILGAERTILNFAQRLCGIATATRRLTQLIEAYPCKLLDTRKTMPGMRALEKEAFRAGGGTNHRFNLSDMVMLKENHLAVLDLDLITTIKSIRARLDERKLLETKIEVEINKDNLAKLDAVLAAPVDIIMLDNFSSLELAPLVVRIRQQNPQVKLEASGGINSLNIIDYAKAGLDYISTGSVFTNAGNLDLSLVVNKISL